MRAGQFAQAVACSIAGPAGYLLLPALAIGAETAKSLMGEHHPLAEAIAAVSMHVFGELSGEKVKSLVERLGAPESNHDLEKVFIEAMAVALEKAREGLSPARQNQYKEWFRNWKGRFRWVREEADGPSILFLGKEAFNPLAFTAVSSDQAWREIRKTLERWAWEQRKIGQHTMTGVLEKPETLPGPLGEYLSITLPEYVQEAVPIVLRTKENSAGWIAWQQRFLEGTYFEIRDTHRDLKKLIEDLANVGGIPSLLEKLHAEIVEVNIRLDRHEHKLDSVLDKLEEMSALRALIAQVRGEAQSGGSQADPAGYLRSLWSRTQAIDLKHFQPPDGIARQFYIEQLYTPLTTVLADDGPARLHGLEEGGKPGDMKLHEALKHPRLVLVGDPGSGKTTFLKRIAFELCHVGLGRNRDLKDDRSRPIERLTSDDWTTLPVLVDAKHLASHIWNGSVPRRGALADDTSPEWLFHYLGETHGLEIAYFRGQAERGCLLLVDAFDEVPDEDQRGKIADLLKNVAMDERFLKTRIVGTSRPGEHGGVTSIAEFRTARIAPLGEGEIATFVENWGRAVHPADQAEASKLIATMKEETKRRQVRMLARNPMMLTALAVLHFVERRLPEQRSELYRSVLEWLAKVRETRRHDGGGHTDFLAKMRILALEMSTRAADMRAEMDLDEAVEVLEEDFQQYSNRMKRRAEARKFLIEEEINSGIIIQSGANVRFWHLTFREALTGQALAEDPERLAELFDSGKLHDVRWRETILLLAGELKRKGNPKVNALLDRMLRHAEAEAAGLTGRARCVGLMGAVLRDLDAWSYKMTEALSERYQKMLGEVEGIFDERKAYEIPFDVRLDAANALGQAGDPRLERDNRIPMFWMGAQKDDPNAPNFDAEAYEDESLVKEIDVAPFSMGRYLVTVSEYQRFADERGYEIEPFWRAGGFGEFTEPEAWEKQKEHLNRPVTGVSWYEAAAYCVSVGGRLPKEAQWEYAARDGRSDIRYPWGKDEPDERRANYGYEGSPGEPTPVGLYPAGATPAGIHDMAGNVWEWTEDDYDAESKVLRGGGWNFGVRNLRVSSRFGVQPIVRGGYIGFRCVWE